MSGEDDMEKEENAMPNGIVQASLLEERTRELRQSESNLAAMINATPESAFLIDTAGLVIACNRIGATRLGLQPEAVVGRLFFDLLPTDIAAARRSVLTRVVETGEALEFEDCLDGRMIRHHLHPLRDDSGTVSRVAIFGQDITRYRHTEKMLADNEKRFRQMFMNAPMPYQSLDEQGNFLDVNQAFLHVLGYTRDELIGRNFGDILHPDWRDHFKQNFPRFKAVGEILGVEFQMVKKDGATILVFFNGRIQRDDVNRFQRTHCIFQDITLSRQVEAALRESEEKYRSLTDDVLDSSMVGISILDSAFRVVWVNHALERYFGLRRNDVIGKDKRQLIREQISDIFDDPETFTAKVFATYDNNTYVEKFECHVMPGEGREGRWLQHWSQPIQAGLYAGGRIEQYYDITDRKLAEQEHEKLQAQLLQSQKMESIGRLASGVAHDFNNMLGVILGYSEFALDQVDSGQPIFDSLQEIRRAAERSANLTRQLLAFARKQTVAPRVLDLNDTVEGMLQMLRRLIGEDINLRWRPASRLWPVWIDPGQIDQILANLCINSRDAISGVGRVTIETGIRTFDEASRDENPEFISGEYVLLAVSDDGCGVDPETREHLFEPFFTTKEIGRGTGLGLATVYGIVKQNNGVITISSEPGQGTTFQIYLPRHVVAATGKTGQDSSAQVARGNETVLLVEDEPAILNLGKIMLERLGYRVLTAIDPQEALALAQTSTETLDLLITDVIMPTMNGRDLADRMKTLYPDIRVLFMSGYTADIIANRGVLDKKVNFVQKPFSLKDLAARVREALGD